MSSVPPVSMPSTPSTPSNNANLGLVLRNLPAPQVERLAHLAESAGFTHVFFPENGHAADGEIIGRDPFLLASAALRATSALRAGPGVAATVVRPHYSTAITSATLHEGSAGRFILGLGVSHASAMARLGEPYPASPMRHLRDYLDRLAATFDRTSYGRGVPTYLSALGPTMLELAATRGDGVMLNWLSAPAARECLERFRSAASARSLPDTSAHSAPGTSAHSTPDTSAHSAPGTSAHSTPDTSAHSAPGEPACSAPGWRPPTSVLYLRTGSPATLEREADQYARFDNYRRHFLRQGLATTPEVVAGTCLPSEPTKMAKRIAEYRAAGVDLPAIYPVDMPADEIATLIEQLATTRP